MVFLLDDQWIYSATDLVGALRCEHQLLRRRAEKAGTIEPLEVPEDPTLARAARLGDEHEARTLRRLVAELGEGRIGAPGGVVSIPRPTSTARQALVEAHEATAAALHGGADVVFQAAFFDGHFHGLADFVSRVPDAEGGLRYEPADTKLARHAKVEALLQLAAYADQLVRMGLPEPLQVHVWLGDGAVSSHRTADLLPVLRARVARMEELLATPPEPPAWADPRIRACGRCASCEAAAVAGRDVLLVAGVSTPQRRSLAEVGLTTIDALAAATEAQRPIGIRPDAFARIGAQARLQLAQDATRSAADPLGTVLHEVHASDALLRLPPLNPGDVFFDFEGDPLHTEGTRPELGLEYLWGTVTLGDDGEPVYDARWAHSRAEEAEVLEQFLDWLAERRRRPGFEGLHVYHYAPYEVTALTRLVQRHGTRADELDQLLRDEVFVDLYSVVRRSIRISERSYSIKKLEPLYMGSDLRTGEVTAGDASIVAYATYRGLLDHGEDAEAKALLDDLTDYNAYDCRSTLRLAQWLHARRAELGDDGDRDCDDQGATTEARTPRPDTAEEAEAKQLAAALVPAPDDPAAPAGVTAGAGTLERSPDVEARALLAAALQYHRRESLPFWWAHYSRLDATPETWERDAEVLVLRPDAVTVVDDWHVPEGTRQNPRRTLVAEVDLPPGCKVSPGPTWPVYEAPLPPGISAPTRSGRGTASATIAAIEHRGERATVTVEETLSRLARSECGDGGFPQLPVALVPIDGANAAPLAKAVLAVARTVEGGSGPLPPHPALDLLRRVPPRLTGGGPRPSAGPDGLVEAITETTRRLDRSYLAVQGPPGTGKTHTGARVIKALVEGGWRIGVVAQSHKAVDNLLAAVLDAGLPAERVAKKLDRRKGEAVPARWCEIRDGDLAAWVTATDGCVVGGSAWDMVNEARVPRGTLDLLVVDEAGQLSLADTLAVSVAAPRLLLLGDPQQLPQVSQAHHPEPVDSAALAWLSGDEHTLPARFGYFLPETRRMRSELTAVVSRLSYEGRLQAHPSADARHLDGVAPGVTTRLVDHHGRTAASPEEAEVVAGLIDDLLGRSWTDGHHPPRPLEVDDIVVVTPYNAQVQLIHRTLQAAGRAGVRVGTVDKFQGQEAPVVIVSMASSSAAGGRGPGFALSRNRLNVAISRAQHTAFLVHAPGLTDLLPGTPRTLTTLGAFLGVSQAGLAPARGPAVDPSPSVAP